MRKAIAFLLAATLSVSAAAVSADAGITVENAWIPATVPGQKVAAAYMEITSPVAAKLVQAHSPAAATLEIHSMAMRNGIMEMRRIDALDLPAGKTVRLGPGGYHVMLIGLKKPLEAGEHVPLTLTVERAHSERSRIRVMAMVRPLGGASGHMGDMKGMKGMKGMKDMKDMGGDRH